MSKTGSQTYSHGPATRCVSPLAGSGKPRTVGGSPKIPAQILGADCVGLQLRACANTRAKEGRKKPPPLVKKTLRIRNSQGTVHTTTAQAYAHRATKQTGDLTWCGYSWEGTRQPWEQTQRLHSTVRVQLSSYVVAHWRSERPQDGKEEKPQDGKTQPQDGKTLKPQDGTEEPQAGKKRYERNALKCVAEEITHSKKKSAIQLNLRNLRNYTVEDYTEMESPPKLVAAKSRKLLRQATLQTYTKKRVTSVHKICKKPN